MIIYIIISLRPSVQHRADSIDDSTPHISRNKMSVNRILPGEEL